MLIFDEDRPSDSPYVEKVWRCHSENVDPFLSIAASRCELVVSKLGGEITMTVRGPETRATSMGDCPGDGEWFGIILKLGTFLPPFPATKLVNGGVNLPTVSRESFWFLGSAWQFPDYDNVETFIARLAREGFLRHDPLVQSALQHPARDRSPRTIQRRFLQATGLTQGEARQIERARHATYLLQQGTSITDATAQAGYFDQAHLTRALKHFIGQTPGQIVQKSQSAQMSFLYKTTAFE